MAYLLNTENNIYK